LKSVSDSILVFAPNVDDIYEGKTVSKHFNFDGLENQMEGKFRPGHFDGVGTIVNRLFEIVKPTNAYFGEKDFQQLQIIKKLVEKQNLPINIVSCPIFREKNGLAMSSRNERLSPNERKSAEIIYKTVLEVKSKFNSETVSDLKSWVEHVFENQNNFKLDYFEIADEATLLPCEEKTDAKKYRAFIAVYVNNIRLIDTISLN
jgi:pantoate--beta-alanine ligase